MTDNG